MRSLTPGPINCPGCHADIAKHPWFVRRRVRELSCPHCGAQIEVVTPAWAHHLTGFAIAILGEGVAAVLLILFFVRSWSGAALLIAIFTAIDLARGAWMRRCATVKWVNQGSMERRAAARWVPE
jgi:hypothetical protein